MPVVVFFVLVFCICLLFIYIFVLCFTFCIHVYVFVWTVPLVCHLKCSYGFFFPFLFSWFSCLSTYLSIESSLIDKEEKYQGKKKKHMGTSSGKLVRLSIGRRNGIKLTKEKNRRYRAQTITDADYADDIALLANAPAQAEFLLHTLKQAAVDIGLHVNADKTECMWFNQRGDTSTLKGSPLKLVEKFTYQGSSVSSTEKDINTQLAKNLS